MPKNHHSPEDYGQLLSQERLKELFYYHPESGDFVRLVRTANCTRVGEQAGYLRKEDGYMAIRIAGVNHLSHRLAVLYMTGKYPTEFADHKDTVKHHNWWSNIRQATRPQNGRNRGAQKNNKSTGHKDIYYRASSRRFHVNINATGRKQFFGSFRTLAEALARRDQVLPQVHGEFARTG